MAVLCKTGISSFVLNSFRTLPCLNMQGIEQVNERRSEEVLERETTKRLACIGEEQVQMGIDGGSIFIPPAQRGHMVGSVNTRTRNEWSNGRDAAESGRRKEEKERRRTWKERRIEHERAREGETGR